MTLSKILLLALFAVFALTLKTSTEHNDEEPYVETSECYDNYCWGYDQNGNCCWTGKVRQVYLKCRTNDCSEAHACVSEC